MSAKYRAKIKNASKVKASVVIACASASGGQFAAAADVALKK